MITAKTVENGQVVVTKVHGVVNRGGWFGKTWLIGIGCGISCHYFVVEADCEQDAIDEFVDSRYGHLIKVDEDEVEEKEREYEALLAEGREEEFEDWPCRGGNCGVPIDFDDVVVLVRCKVNYFASQTVRCVNHDPARL